MATSGRSFFEKHEIDSYRANKNQFNKYNIPPCMLLYCNKNNMILSTVYLLFYWTIVHKKKQCVIFTACKMLSAG